MSNKLSRRKFLKKCRQTGYVISAGIFFQPFMPSLLKAKDDAKAVDLAVVQGNPDKAAAKAFELLGGIQKFVHQNDLVLLKPNASFPNPKIWGSTTNPEVVKAVAQLVLQAGAKRVIVVDNTMQNSDLCFERTGLRAELKELEKVKIIPLQKESYFTEVTVPNGKALKTVKIAKLIKKCNLLINLPCAKSHTATDVSFGVKNLMGLIWDRQYFHNSTDLHTAIAELATVIRPQITMLDATRALLTNGPTGPGKVHELNTIIAGTDMLAVDAYAAGMANWNNRLLTAQSIKHLSYASTLGIGEIDLEKLLIKKAAV
jgi:uncharacterized protein (DUF362 family)